MTDQTRGRILVVDDEEIIRTLSRKVLVKHGYDVASVATGDDGVQAYGDAHRKENPFDAVLLDLTLSEGLSGMDTLSELKSIDPDVKAIVCSGYSSDPVVVDWKKYGFAGSIVKPFRAEELANAVSAVLTANP